MIVGGPDGLQVIEGTILGFTPAYDPDIRGIDWRFIDYSHSNGYPDEASWLRNIRKNSVKCPLSAFIGTFFYLHLPSSQPKKKIFLLIFSRKFFFLV
jgi:hypothetical protein